MMFVAVSGGKLSPGDVRCWCVSAPAQPPGSTLGSPSGGGDQSTVPLGPTLAPQLAEATNGRLGPVRWFRSDWQRGGGSTGFSTYQTDDGAKVDVVVKIPVGYQEWKWTSALGNPANCPPRGGSGSPGGCDCPTPKCFAGGIELCGYDLGWLVIEKLPGTPIAGKLSPESLRDLFAATALFHQRAGLIEPVSPAPPPPPWDDLVSKSRETLDHHAIPDEQRWRSLLTEMNLAMPRLMRMWALRSIDTWCHGDLHPGNAMRRKAASTASTAPAQTGADAGSNEQADLPTCVLIDLALVHAGSWIEDAIYFERVHWGHEAMLRGVSPLEELAEARRKLGLPTGRDYAALADARRLLMAACAPAFIEREGNAKYMRAALEMAEDLIGRA